MKKKINFTKTKFTIEETNNKELVIQYLDEHYTKGDIFEWLCCEELIIAEEVPWKTTKRELLEEHWDELIDILIQTDANLIED